MSLMDVASALIIFPVTVECSLISAGGSRSILRTIRTPFGCATTLTQSGFGRFPMGSRPWLPLHTQAHFHRAWPGIECGLV